MKLFAAYLGHFANRIYDEYREKGKIKNKSLNLLIACSDQWKKGEVRQ